MLVGAIAQRIAGMGYSLTVAPILVLAIGPYEGPLVVNLAGAFSSLLVLAQTYRQIDWRQFWLLTVPAFILIIPSSFLSAAISGPILQIAIGVILLVGLLASLLAVRSTRLFRRGPLALIFGATSGFMSATAGIGGSAMGIYAILTGWEQRSFAATLQPYFLMLGLTAFASKIFASGQMPLIPLTTWALILGLTVVGSLAGIVLQKYVSARAARLIVVLVCFAGSVAAIVDGLIHLQQS